MTAERATEPEQRTSPAQARSGGGSLQSALADLLSMAEFVTPTGEPPPCRDEADRKYLHCAVAAQADFLLTHDADLFELRDVDGIPILTPGAFVALCRENGWPLAG